MAALKPIVHANLIGSASATKLGTTVHALFLSLLGAIAYALLTRMDIAVYVAALQRAAHEATVLRLKRLNAVVRLGPT